MQSIPQTGIRQKQCSQRTHLVSSASWCVSLMRMRYKKYKTILLHCIAQRKKSKLSCKHCKHPLGRTVHDRLTNETKHKNIKHLGKTEVCHRTQTNTRTSVKICFGQLNPELMCLGTVTEDMFGANQGQYLSTRTLIPTVKHGGGNVMVLG